MSIKNLFVISFIFMALTNITRSEEDYKNKVCILNVVGTINSHQSIHANLNSEQIKSAITKGLISKDLANVANEKSIKLNKNSLNSLSLLNITLKDFHETNLKYPLTSKFMRMLRKNKKTLSNVVLENQKELDALRLSMDPSDQNLQFHGQLSLVVLEGQIVPSLTITKLKAAGLSVQVQPEQQGLQNSYIGTIAATVVGTIVGLRLAVEFLKYIIQKNMN
ncbi:hypothetical protein MJH12_12635 [bacterium]|nr:hypothetical protein [bacterium]